MKVLLIGTSVYGEVVAVYGRARPGVARQGMARTPEQVTKLLAISVCALGEACPVGVRRCGVRTGAA